MWSVRRGEECPGNGGLILRYTRVFGVLLVWSRNNTTIEVEATRGALECLVMVVRRLAKRRGVGCASEKRRRARNEDQQFPKQSQSHWEAGGHIMTWQNRRQDQMLK